MKQIFAFIVLSFSMLFLSETKAHALQYTYCTGPDQSAACFIALEKLKTIKNPLSGQNYFDDDIHYPDGSLFMYPSYNIAETDLDKDGFAEIIVVIPEPEQELQGMFCQTPIECPHYILQDRNIDGKKMSFNKIKAMGPIYAFAIGLSTDEVVGGYRSLRVYTDPKSGAFNVYQYDRKNDDYFNITPPQ